jgi:hypothetical protein
MKICRRVWRGIFVRSFALMPLYISQSLGLQDLKICLVDVLGSIESMRIVLFCGSEFLKILV